MLSDTDNELEHSVEQLLKYTKIGNCFCSEKGWFNKVHIRLYVDFPVPSDLKSDDGIEDKDL